MGVEGVLVELDRLLLVQVVSHGKPLIRREADFRSSLEAANNIAQNKICRSCSSRPRETRQAVAEGENEGGREEEEAMKRKRKRVTASYSIKKQSKEVVASGRRNVSHYPQAVQDRQVGPSGKLDTGLSERTSSHFK